MPRSPNAPTAAAPATAPPTTAEHRAVAAMSNRDILAMRRENVRLARELAAATDRVRALEAGRA